MRKIIAFKSISSTNNYLKSEYKNLEDGCVVWSEEQSQGRGRLNRTWVSEVGNLYFSILIKDNVNHDSFYGELRKVSLSILKLLATYNIKAQIKYPNDILVDKKKIAGILIESKGFDQLEYLIVGIGLNVNQSDFGTLNDKATSIGICSKQEVDVKSVLLDFIDIYDKEEGTIEEYNRNSLIIGKWITYNNGQYFVKDIDHNGDMVLEQGSNVVRVKFNEISLEEIYDEFNN